MIKGPDHAIREMRTLAKGSTALDRYRRLKARNRLPSPYCFCYGFPFFLIPFVLFDYMKLRVYEKPENRIKQEQLSVFSFLSMVQSLNAKWGRSKASVGGPKGLAPL